MQPDPQETTPRHRIIPGTLGDRYRVSKLWSGLVTAPVVGAKSARRGDNNTRVAKGSFDFSLYGDKV